MVVCNVTYSVIRWYDFQFYGSGATLLYESRCELSTFWCYVPLLYVTFWFVWSFVTYEREKRERERELDESRGRDFGGRTIV